MRVDWLNVIRVMAAVSLLFLLLAYLNGCAGEPRFANGDRVILGGDGVVNDDMPGLEK